MLTPLFRRKILQAFKLHHHFSFNGHFTEHRPGIMLWPHFSIVAGLIRFSLVALKTRTDDITPISTTSEFSWLNVVPVHLWHWDELAAVLTTALISQPDVFSCESFITCLLWWKHEMH